MTRIGRSYSPCQITGFFRIHDRTSDSLKKGSTGAGVNLEQGVTTSVRINRTPRTRISVSYNGKPLVHPVVSNQVVQEYLESSREPLRVLVSHMGVLPMGCGYGTSGAGALSLSLAMNEALGSDLSRIEAAQIAHRAEVENKTGLGTVTSAFYGGLAVRIRPGAPGFCRVEKLAPSASVRIVSGTFGPISTPTVLSNDRLRTRINACSKGLVSQQIKSPETDTFMMLSRKFADCLNVFSPKLRNALRRMQSQQFCSSMMMIGESIFTMVQEDLVRETRAAIRAMSLKPVVSRIANYGAIVL